jgi:pimeloyl-ACP methyl ester carboxylesterase
VKPRKRLESLSPLGPRPDPTPANGPDPYGDSRPEWLRIDWRQHLRTIDVSLAAENGAGSAGETTVNYVEMGPPQDEQAAYAIVFVHGLSGCWQNWLEQLPHFARSYRLIALDLPGFGFSPTPPWEISIPNLGRLLRGLCDALEVRDAIVIGHSLGGFVAAETVISEPNRFERLVLVSAAGISSARLRREPTEVAARMVAAGAPYAFNLQTRSFRRRRARAIAFRNIVRHPSEIPAELLWEFFQGGMRGAAFT